MKQKKGVGLAEGKRKEENERLKDGIGEKVWHA